MSKSLPTHLDGNALADALISGIHRVIGQQELLNRINVFPVPDGDTGTNLSLSLGAALPLLNSANEKHLGTLLAATADALLDGARGNSGAIVAQFFQGLSDSAGELSRFTTYTFGKAVRQGSDYAHDALSAPRDGTILTAIAAFADSVINNARRNPEHGFDDVVDAARVAVDEAVRDTPKQLDVLRKAGVVDAGAKGFAELIGGMAAYFRDGDVAPLPESFRVDALPELNALSADETSSKFRYCTECLVTADDIERRKLREKLSELGDSLVLAGSKRKAKVHIHADDPDAVFELAAEFGEVSGQKADDMHRQQGAAHASDRAFAVITDSGADISDQNMERLDIHMVPCRIQFGDRGYLDKLSISTDEFFRELRSNPNHPTTSQPAPGDFRRQFQFLSSHFQDVLSINLTSRASGTYEAARQASKRIEAAGEIHVLDSRSASLGQGHLVVLAAKCAAAGYSIDETLPLLHDAVPQVKTFALIEDLSYAVKGGRLPRWAQVVADALRLAPILSFDSDGVIGMKGWLLGRRNRALRFAVYVAKRIADDLPAEISVGHAICRDDAENLARQLQKELNLASAPPVTTLGTALGVHGGPGTLIVSSRPRLPVDDLAVGDH